MPKLPKIAPKKPYKFKKWDVIQEIVGQGRNTVIVQSSHYDKFAIAYIIYRFL